MFPRLPRDQPSRDALDELIDVLSRRTGNAPNDAIAAGFTYLAQFIDHDITFDPTPLSQRAADPDALVSFRTPRLDLDSVYGSGPSDQPYLYEWTDERDAGVKFLVDERPRLDRSQTQVHDLPRNTQGRALTGDPRNDEHAIIAQLHVLFLRFHNRVVDELRATGTTGDDLFREAQQLVRWHYQWIVVQEFLRLVLAPGVAASLLPQPDGTPGEGRRHFTWKHEPFIPLEFSGAAYRFGHSMVRPDYRINGVVPPVRLFPQDDETGLFLHGFRRLDPALAIEWERFFELGGPAGDLIMARAIDTNLTTRLHRLPRGVATDAAPLFALNLERGRRLELPPGPAVAEKLEQPALSAEQLRIVEHAGFAPFRDELLHKTPLWYYVLCEAESERGAKGRHLGPVGSRIVGEVLLGLIEGDPRSYLSQPEPWTPTLGSPKGTFSMAQLIRFTRSAPPA